MIRDLFYIFVLIVNSARSLILSCFKREETGPGRWLSGQRCLLYKPCDGPHKVVLQPP